MGEKFYGKEAVNFKVKEAGGMWKDAKIILRREFADNEVAKIEEIADILSEALLCEVRWNWDESFQGHYVMSKKALYVEIEKKAEVK